jgi:hypothetical protein
MSPEKYTLEKEQLANLEALVVADGLKTVGRVVERLQANKGVKADLELLQQAVKACHQLRSLMGVPSAQ